MTTPAMPMFTDSQAGGNWDGNITPWIRDLMGRFLFLEPVAGSYDPDNEMAGKKRPAIRANVLVLDASQFGLVGGVLEFGGKAGSVSEPHTDRIGTPAHFKGVKISNDSIVKALVEADADRASGKTGGWKVGVVEEGKGTQGNNPIHLCSAKTDYHGRTRPMADQLWAWAEGQFMAFLGGTLPLHAQSELIVPTPHAGPDVHKRHQERVKARAGLQQDTVTAQPQPTGPTYQAQPVAAASQYAPGQPPQTSQVHGYAPDPLSAPTAPASPDNEVPPGWDPQAWGNLDQGMRTMIWGQVRGAQATAVQPTH
jgi:hypothetical protein